MTSWTPLLRLSFVCQNQRTASTIDARRRSRSQRPHLRTALYRFGFATFVRSFSCILSIHEYLLLAVRIVLEENATWRRQRVYMIVL